MNQRLWLPGLHVYNNLVTVFGGGTGKNRIEKFDGTKWDFVADNLETSFVGGVSAASSTSNISVTSASTALSTTASVLPSSAASNASAASAASAASPTSAAPDCASQVI